MNDKKDEINEKVLTSSLQGSVPRSFSPPHGMQAVQMPALNPPNVTIKEGQQTDEILKELLFAERDRIEAWNKMTEHCVRLLKIQEEENKNRRFALRFVSVACIAVLLSTAASAYLNARSNISLSTAVDRSNSSQVQIEQSLAIVTELNKKALESSAALKREVVTLTKQAEANAASQRASNLSVSTMMEAISSGTPQSRARAQKAAVAAEVVTLQAEQVAVKAESPEKIQEVEKALSSARVKARNAGISNPTTPFAE